MMFTVATISFRPEVMWVVKGSIHLEIAILVTGCIWLNLLHVPAAGNL